VLNTGKGVKGGGNHYCTLAFLVCQRTIYILGRNIGLANKVVDNKDWESWGGRRIWSYACSLFGWNVDELGPMRLHSINWPQNGVDCGHISCQVAQHLLKEGLVLKTGQRKWLRPTLSCSHPLQIKLAETLYHTISRGIRLYEQHSYDHLREHLDDTEEYNNTAETVKTWLASNGQEELAEVLGSIQSAMRVCPKCKASGFKAEGSLAGQQEVDMPQRRTEVDKEDTRDEIDSQALGQEKGKEDEEANPGTLVRTWHLHVQDWTQARLGRYPWPRDAPRVTGELKKVIQWDHLFDDYEDAPSDEALVSLKLHREAWEPTLAYILNHTFVTPTP